MTLPVFFIATTNQALKLIGADLLSDKFQIDERDILFEQQFNGFEVDVIDRGKTFPIECGDTNAIKFEHYLTTDGVKHMVIIPYPRDTEIFAFIFTALPKFSDYVFFKRDFLRKKMRRR